MLAEDPQVARLDVQIGDTGDGRELVGVAENWSTDAVLVGEVGQHPREQVVFRLEPGQERRERVLLGAFIAAPGAAEAIGEAVLAIKTRTSIDILADTIHPFPTTARVMGGLFAQAARQLHGATTSGMSGGSKQ